ncbi:CxC2 domain-containing protein [Mycena kentingensis (nom. inval.)]|nr:CxC2 domain-containing protein [Mycena kentingensis (nom. inval.)]
MPLPSNFSFPTVAPFIGPMAAGSHLAIEYSEEGGPAFVALPFPTLSHADDIHGIGKNPLKCSECPRMAVQSILGVYVLLEGCDHGTATARRINQSLPAIMPQPMRELVPERRGNLILVKLSPSTPAQTSRFHEDDPSMAEWVREYRASFLDALLWLDGRGFYDQPMLCPRCGDASQAAIYRCCDCAHAPLRCRGCIVAEHARQPLHWIEKWTGMYFQRDSLKNAGLRIQLGHVEGEPCLVPHAGHSDFTIMHLNGIHDVAVDFCGCEHHERADHATQLLHSRYYPSTGPRPRTCATFACLDDFHSLSLYAKTSAYDYYRALEYRTNASGVKPLERGAAELTRRRQSKRPSRVNSPFGVRHVRNPGVNLPDDWENAAPSDQCLYIMFIAMDACFRLKRRLIGSDLRDPGLTTGWAYFVEWEPYRNFLLTVTDQKEISSCTGLAALDHANTKFARGYSATGVGAGVCARHEFVLPNGVGDLQRGERYANMDYILASLLRHIPATLRKIFSYDIACQWFKELKSRLLALPPLVRLRLALDLCQFAVPKMHIHAHILICRLLFSLGLIPGSGATDGEGIERLWAAIAGVAGSTKLSGHGARADQLDDHLSFSNWCKLVGLAKLLRRRLENAKIESRKQDESFRVFCAQQAEHPNPYQSEESEAMTEAEVRKTLEEEDRQRLEKGGVALHAVTPLEFVSFALEVEEDQRRLRVQAQLKRGNMATTPIRLKPMRKKLSQSIKHLRELQATYTPTSLTHLASLNVGEDVSAENIPLLLPSDLPASLRSGCQDGIVGIERQLRHAQCKSAIAQLRHQLQIKARLLIYKKHQSRHQRMNTRSHALVARNEVKIKGHSDMYQASRAALSNLEPAVAWPPLLPSDIRCLEDPDAVSKREAQNRRQLAARLERQVELLREGIITAEDIEFEGEGDEEDEVLDAPPAKSSGETRRAISWIWTLSGTTGTDASLLTAMRVEWCRAYARARRWQEEIRILEEETRRLRVSLSHEGRIWALRGLAIAEGGGNDRVKEGRAAYAAKQAAMYDEMALRAELIRTEIWKGRGHRKHAQRARLDEAVEEDGHPDAAEQSDDDDEQDSDDDEEDEEDEDEED